MQNQTSRDERSPSKLATERSSAQHPMNLVTPIVSPRANWAVWFSQQDIAVIPLQVRDKPPVVANWQHALPMTVEQCLYWFGGPPDKLSMSWNLGVVLGVNSKNLIVVDWDNLDAYLRWSATVSELYKLNTLTVRTSRGVHAYYFCEELPAHKLKLVDEDGHLVGDVLTTGCYVVGPSSIHPTGIEYTPYTNDDISIIESIEELELPLKVRSERLPPTRAAVDEHGTDPVTYAPLPDAYVNAGIRALVDLLRTAQDGNRNNLLFWAACRAFDDGLNLEAVERLLGPVATDSAGLTERETYATIASAERANRQPVTAPAQPKEHTHTRRPSTITERARMRSRRLHR